MQRVPWGPIPRARFMPRFCGSCLRAPEWLDSWYRDQTWALVTTRRGPKPKHTWHLVINPKYAGWQELYAEVSRCGMVRRRHDRVGWVGAGAEDMRRMDDPHGIAEDWNSPEDEAAWGVDDE